MTEAAWTGPEMDDRTITPETARGLWQSHRWSDGRFMEWMKNRAEITEARAREIVLFIKGQG